METSGLELVPTEDTDDKVAVADLVIPPTKIVCEIGDDDAKDGGGAEPEDEEKSVAPTTMMGHIRALPTNILKQADQSSPLLLIKMPRVIAFTIAILLFGAYVIGFVYQLAQMYGNCSEQNNCIVCAITLEEVEGSDCQRLANTQLDVRAGCMSFGLPNQFDLVEDILVNTRAMGDTMEGLVSEDFRQSFMRHGEIVEAIQKNNRNQMTDPDVGKLRDFFKANFMGISKSFSSPDDIDALDDSVVVSAGLKVLFSYISIGCAMYSSAEYNEIKFSGYNYTTVGICGCDLRCPTNITIVEGSIDPSIPLAESRHNNLGQLALALPSKYVQEVNPDYDTFQAALEYLYFTAMAAPSHCPISAFTSTPSTLNGVLYECCTEKSNVEKLSETSAFAGLVLTFAIVATTILFYPWSPKDESIKDELKENVMGLLGG